jgi:hypothetical protein
MAKRTVARISNVVLKWLIPALWCRLIATRTGAILDLLSRAGYRAKEMPSWCSHFALEHQTETVGEPCPRTFESRRSAFRALINIFVITRARVYAY